MHKGEIGKHHNRDGGKTQDIRLILYSLEVGELNGVTNTQSPIIQAYCSYVTASTVRLDM